MIDEEKSKVLRSCPFCGGKANVHFIEKEHPFVYRVQCSICFAMGGHSYSYSEYNSAIREWNKRVVSKKL